MKGFRDLGHSAEQEVLLRIQAATQVHRERVEILSLGSVTVILVHPTLSTAPSCPILDGRGSARSLQVSPC